MEPKEFDSLSTEIVSSITAKEFLKQPLMDLPPPTKFKATGMYGIFYRAKKPLYGIVTDSAEPLYIGLSEKDIYKRLSQHAQSIVGASNLKIKDFACRYLWVNTVPAKLAEWWLIKKFSPLWNHIGFEAKVVGGRRLEQDESKWDSLHPGLAGRAAKNPNKKSPEEILRDLREFASQRPLVVLD